MIDIESLIGLPFKNFGTNPKEGFDCYGLVVYVYKKFFNIEIPNYNHNLINAFNSEDIHKVIEEERKNWKRLKIPKKPALVLIKNHPIYINHIGVYIGEDRFIHALDKVGVIMSSINDKYWKRKIVGFLKWIK